MFESVEKLNNQAIEYASKGNFADAIACFKRALIVEQENYLLWFNLSLTYRESGNFVEAINACRHAHNLNPDNSEIIETLAFLYYNVGENHLAMSYAFLGTENNKCSPTLWNMMGVIQFRNEDYESAAGAFETALTINPYFEEAIFNLRDTYEELGNIKGAKECDRRLKELKK